jgi:hypothetical protein
VPGPSVKFEAGRRVLPSEPPRSPREGKERETGSVVGRIALVRGLPSLRSRIVNPLHRASTAPTGERRPAVGTASMLATGALVGICRHRIPIVTSAIEKYLYRSCAPRFGRLQATRTFPHRSADPSIVSGRCWRGSRSVTAYQRGSTGSASRESYKPSSRPMTIRWISEVPSPISMSLASR